MVTVEYLSDRETPTGWRYLWSKLVTGFDPRYHCARSLIGEYQTNFGLEMATGEQVQVAPLAKPGDVLYFCGVAAPNNYHHNFHLAGVVDPLHPAPLVMDTHKGHFLVFRNLRPLPFTDRAARRLYPGKGEAYLTCRNFQFGAHHFGI